MYTLEILVHEAVEVHRFEQNSDFRQKNRFFLNVRVFPRETGGSVEVMEQHRRSNAAGEKRSRCFHKKLLS